MGRPTGTASARDNATGAFLSLVETMAGLGVSCVAEYVIRDDRPEDLERITRVARCVGCGPGVTTPRRRATREQADPLLRRPPVLAALGYRTIDEHVAQATTRMAEVTSQMRTAFDFPVLGVSTNDGYDLRSPRSSSSSRVAPMVSRGRRQPGWPPGTRCRPWRCWRP